MKIKAEHFERLKTGIEQAIESLPVDWLADRVLCDASEHGYTTERARWDVFWHARHKGYLVITYKDVGEGIPLYEYLNDEHIDTALRKIMDDRFDIA